MLAAHVMRAANMVAVSFVLEKCLFYIVFINMTSVNAINQVRITHLL